MSVWCVFYHDSEGVCESPSFFNSKEKAIEFIRRENELYSCEDDEKREEYEEKTICAGVWNDGFSAAWEGFDVTNEVVGVLKKEI